MTSTGLDWWAWHRAYDESSSPLARRLRIVQGRIRDVLDAQPPGRIPAISLCAGQGRDLLGVLADHPRRADVHARLVELDARNVAAARDAVARLGLDTVEVVEADAGHTDAYRGAVPAALVLACGIFGNITDDDIRRTVARLPALCAPPATVIWTRHRLPPDLTGPIRAWFAEQGFEEVGFDVLDGVPQSVGTHRYAGPAVPLPPGERLFTFVSRPQPPDTLAPPPPGEGTTTAG